MRNTRRQPNDQPPSSGPIALAKPPSPDQVPTAHGRWPRTNEAWMIAGEPGVSSAPPAGRGRR
ncbi:hypothetical protein ACFWY5_37325 [Nonomuraea sp. NPDC059007]|uniref:hypothetical protein n=1 Tax=Nonomuraea sp. NPDC059007 TaxID=3346692 RepID=UPI00367E6FD0